MLSLYSDSVSKQCAISCPIYHTYTLITMIYTIYYVYIPCIYCTHIFTQLSYTVAGTVLLVGAATPGPDNSVPRTVVESVPLEQLRTAQRSLHTD